MAFEILSTKIYTPYLGSSIYVWTSVLTVTLIGLELGYRLGGRWSKDDLKKKLIMSYAISGIFVLLSTFIAEATLPALGGTSVRVASILAGFLILFVPVLLMGTVSPLIIAELNRNGSKLSAATGLIFGTGTFGGIILLLITVFTLIPTIGVKNSSYLLGVLMLVGAVVVSLLTFKKDD